MNTNSKKRKTDSEKNGEYLDEILKQTCKEIFDSLLGRIPKIPEKERRNLGFYIYDKLLFLTQVAGEVQANEDRKKRQKNGESEELNSDVESSTFPSHSASSQNDVESSCSPSYPGNEPPDSKEEIIDSKNKLESKDEMIISKEEEFIVSKTSNPNQNTIHIYSFPVPILESIFMYVSNLNWRALYPVRLTCKKFRTIISACPALWFQRVPFFHLGEYVQQCEKFNWNVSSLKLIKRREYDQLKQGLSVLHLKELDFSSYSELCDEELVFLPTQLEKLNLSWCKTISPDGIRILPPLLELKLSNFPSIEKNHLKFLPSSLLKLELRNCQKISLEGMRYLPTSLTSLDVERSRHFDDQFLPYLPATLKELSLNECRYITNDGLASLPKGLTSLSLKYCRISNFGIQNLPNSLIKLNLTGTFVDNQCIEHLPFPLQQLILNECKKISDVGLIKLPYSLTYLHLNLNEGITNKGISFLLNRLSNDRPPLQIVFEKKTNLLFWACERGYEDIVHLLLTKFDGHNLINKLSGESSLCTPLFIAASKGYLQIVRLLLNNGADPTICRNPSETPFIAAAANGHLGTIMILAKHPQVNINEKFENKTALQWAQLRQSSQVIDYLETL